MKLIIDIPIEVYEKQNFSNYFGAWSEKLQETIEGGNPIRGNLTNGDVLKTIFPNIEKECSELVDIYGTRVLYDGFAIWCARPF